MNLFKIISIVSLFSVATVSHAGLQVDYGGKKELAPQQQTTSDMQPSNSKKLLLDNSVVNFQQSGKCDSEKVYGSGSGVELSQAIKLILPNGWRVYADEGANYDKVQLSWVSGEEFSSVVRKMADGYQLRTEFNCAEKTVSIHPSQSRGIFAGNSNVDLSESIKPFKVAEAQPSVTQTNSLQAKTTTSLSASVDPMQGESIATFIERYAVNNGYSRVAVKGRSVTKKIQNQLEFSAPFNMDAALKKSGLYLTEGLDGVSNERVLVVSEISYEKGSRLLVFPVQKGFLSRNAENLAQMTGKTIGDNDRWEFDEDYEIPFSYDIVGDNALDLFMALFAAYPVQAQFVVGQKSVHVVKRETANRQN